jgi:hypothetical protein
MADEAGRLAIVIFVITPLSWRSGGRDNDCLGICDGGEQRVLGRFASVFAILREDGVEALDVGVW